MADDSANTLSRHYTYDPDGNASTTGSGTTTNLLFASGHQTGSLYHYAARYYDPTTATWTQQDPLNQITSLTQANHYTYVGGDPIDGTDPTGLQGSPCAGDRPSPSARANNPSITVSWCKRYQRSKGNGPSAGCVVSAAGTGGSAVLIVAFPPAGVAAAAANAAVLGLSGASTAMSC